MSYGAFNRGYYGGRFHKTHCVAGTNKIQEPCFRVIQTQKLSKVNFSRKDP
jgi:hypothetical protein